MITWLDGDRSGDRLAVYHNRHNRGDKTRLWSIKEPNGAVVGYADALLVEDAVFVTKKRAIHRMWNAVRDQECPCRCGTGPRGGKKNVFAWVTGFVSDNDLGHGVEWHGTRRVTFRPDVHDEFFNADRFDLTGEFVGIQQAQAVEFDADGRCWID